MSGFRVNKEQHWFSLKIKVRVLTEIQLKNEKNSEKARVWKKMRPSSKIGFSIKNPALKIEKIRKLTKTRISKPEQGLKRHKIREIKENEL
ncbi:MAG: hypothetical protein ACQEP1_03680 [Nanobdellota archaeon]